MHSAKSMFLSSVYEGHSPIACRFRNFELCFKINRCFDLDLEIANVAQLAHISLAEANQIAGFIHKWTRLESLRNEYMSHLRENLGISSQKC